MKKILLSAFTCLALTATTYAKNDVEEVKSINSHENTAVECVYTIWVYDKGGNHITSYSVGDDKTGGVDCIRAILLEVAFLEHKYVGATITYELLAS